MREKAKVKMQMINANIYLRKHLYDLSREIYGKDE